jgi:hypothetical protein
MALKLIQQISPFKTSEYWTIGEDRKDQKYSPNKKIVLFGFENEAKYLNIKKYCKDNDIDVKQFIDSSEPVYIEFDNTIFARENITYDQYLYRQIKLPKYEQKLNEKGEPVLEDEKPVMINVNKWTNSEDLL